MVMALNSEFGVGMFGWKNRLQLNMKPYVFRGKTFQVGCSIFDLLKFYFTNYQ